MTESTPAVDITQDCVNALLARMKELREQIAAAREAVAPLEANLALAYEEFQAVVGHLRRQAVRLQAEIRTLRIQIDTASRGQGDTGTSSLWNEHSGGDTGDDWLDDSHDGNDGETGNDTEGVRSAVVDPDAVEKDVLLEHLYRVLDPMVNDEDADLLANLQGSCNDPATGLADVLERLPWDSVSWGSIWGTRGLQEDLNAQYRRLEAWERAFTSQLENVNRAAELLRKDQRYGLWQRRQKGPEVWRDFLNQAAEQQKDVNEELKAELEERREEWTQITRTT